MKRAAAGPGGMTRKAVGLAIAGAFLAHLAPAQTRQESISESIKFLLRPPDLMESRGLSRGCSDGGEDRTTAKSLAKKGALAIPEIEEALQWLEQDPFLRTSPPHVEWLLYAYAKLKGQGTYSLLQQ